MPTKTKAKTNENEAETAVRTYLTFLDDPAKLRDEKEIQKRTQAVLDAKDPLDKLKALAELERVANIDPDPLRKGFVEHVKDWADENNIPLAAFRELKVPDDVLRAAGFDVAASERRNGRQVGRKRAKAVPTSDIKAWVLKQTDVFLLDDVRNGVGGSDASIRSVLKGLVKAGKLTDLGAVPDWKGRGRAPLRYQVA